MTDKLALFGRAHINQLDLTRLHQLPGGVRRNAAGIGQPGLLAEPLRMTRVVDLPPEEAAELEGPAQEAGLHLVYLLAPTSTTDRIAVVTSHASGFIYCVSVTGVTGARTAMSDQLPDFLARVRAQTDLPLAVGFGISNREHVQAVGAVADAAVMARSSTRVVSSDRVSASD